MPKYFDIDWERRDRNRRKSDRYDEGAAELAGCGWFGLVLAALVAWVIVRGGWL